MTDSHPFGLPRDVVGQIKMTLASFSGIEQAVLYGSRALGRQKPGSDIDLCLKGKGLTLSLINSLRTQLDDLMLPYSIDLSVYDQIENADLIAHVDRVGVIFYP